MPDDTSCGTCSPFASSSVSRHLLRGGVAGASIAAGLALLGMGGALATAGAVAAFGLALVMMRGCPMCWTAGLIETIVARRAARAASPVKRESPTT